MCTPLGTLHSIIQDLFPLDTMLAAALPPLLLRPDTASESAKGLGTAHLAFQTHRQCNRDGKKYSKPHWCALCCADTLVGAQGLSL